MWASRATGRGRGSSIGGEVALRIDPSAKRNLGRGRTTLLIVGTNGKTTTNLFAVSALSALGPVASNSRGSNKREGLVSALAASPQAPIAALEVAEIDAARAISALDPAAIIALNLSNEQSDRADDLRAVERVLRESLTGLPGTVVVANCDDVNIVSMAYDAPHVVWVACGAATLDRAIGCPRCGSPISWITPDEATDPESWSCTGCLLTSPTPDWRLVDDTLIGPGGIRTVLNIQLPGRANRGNAAQAIAAATALGVDPVDAARRVSTVDNVVGRYRTIPWGLHRARPMMAKNPVGMQECLSIIDPEAGGIVIAVNGRKADSENLAWLWDVDFSSLSGAAPSRSQAPVVIAAGESAADLSVRLFHAGVEHVVEADALSAIERCPAGRVDVLADYTVMTALTDALESPKMTTRAGPASTGPEPDGTAPDGTAPDGTAPDGTEPDAPAMRIRMSHHHVSDTSMVRIGLLLPTVLGIGGDSGNAVVLRDRLRLRGHRAEIIPTSFHDPAPSSFDIYVIGGPEHAELELACRMLREHGNLPTVIEQGVPVLAISGGMQILGHRHISRDGRTSAGLGLLDCRTVPPAAGEAPLISGRMIAQPLLDELTEPLIGFESHAGRTVLGEAASPLARVVRGVGNGADPVEGLTQGSVIGTHLHGPVLAYNPELADLLCARALGLRRVADLPGLDIQPVSALRAERLR